MMQMIGLKHGDMAVVVDHQNEVDESFYDTEYVKGVARDGVNGVDDILQLDVEDVGALGLLVADGMEMVHQILSRDF